MEKYFVNRSFVLIYILDEITLQLNKDENIHCIKGHFHKEKIQKLIIITSHGKFCELGENLKKFNFQWDYHHNQKTFDGFIVGWDDKHINYLANIYVNFIFIKIKLVK